MKKLRAGRGVPLAAVVLLASGCFGYGTTEPGLVPVGEEVRVQLTPRGTAGLPELPEEPGSTVRGRMVGMEGDLLLLRVRVAVQQDGLVARDLGRDVRIPLSRIERVEARRLDRARTGLAVAGALGVVALLLRSLGDGGAEGGATPPAPPVEAVRIPRLSLPVP